MHFKNLGLLIVDEEQRFGVKHKEQLKKLRESIDVLTLTATPIPRTLHMGLVGIREISVIETPPEGRLPIKTYLQPFDDRLMREAILRELDREGQVYVVHNKVETIEAMAERMRALVPEARVVVAHGQMDDAQLEKVMLAFARREVRRAGLQHDHRERPGYPECQHHRRQQRAPAGPYAALSASRTGRAQRESGYAYLLYPRDVQLSRDACGAMEAVFEAQDLGAGFNIAMKDLEIRGAGNLLGAEQSGNATADRLRPVHPDDRGGGGAPARRAGRGAPAGHDRSSPHDVSAARVRGSETERLTLYRRLAPWSRTSKSWRRIEEEMRDRFGALPAAVAESAPIGAPQAPGGARPGHVDLARTRDC